jgi:glycosyltransferase involved in cell wall biosynthesis
MNDLAVIMSVYKNDKLKYVIESVQSILNQTFTQFHYYLVFDGPVATDIDSYISNIGDDRIKLFKLEENGGLAKALNYLLEIVLKNPEYKFIARMDADDISLPSRFEKQRTFLINNPDISVLGCWYEEITEDGKHLSYRRLPVDHESLRKRYYTRTPFAHPSVMYRRNLIEMVGFYPTDTIFMEDNVLWGRALKRNFKFANIPEFLLRFRIDNDFFIRRSGMHYGRNYIATRFKILKDLKLPFRIYLCTIIIGFLKMLPSFMLRIVYNLYK